MRALFHFGARGTARTLKMAEPIDDGRSTLTIALDTAARADQTGSPANAAIAGTRSAIGRAIYRRFPSWPPGQSAMEPRGTVR
jgi:hypothetical protein